MLKWLRAFDENFSNEHNDAGFTSLNLHGHHHYTIVDVSRSTVGSCNNPKSYVGFDT